MREEKCKFLGIYINSNLDWSDQISYARKLMSQSIGALYSAKSAVPQKILRVIYFSLVQPYFIYAMSIWASNHSSKDFDLLFKLQKKLFVLLPITQIKLKANFSTPNHFLKNLTF